MNLLQELRRREKEVVRTSIDNFHNSLPYC